MLPIASTAQMRAGDELAGKARGVDALVRAAGSAVAVEARRLLGADYGKHVAVIAGPGLNGADGRVAARHLRERGARVTIFPVSSCPPRLRGYDLIVDAAFGLGCSRPYVAPEIEGDTPVLAVDLPSGVDADTGGLMGEPLHATVTVALGALKYAHVTGDAASYAGVLRLHDLGITTSSTSGLMEDVDLSHLINFSASDHKWKHAVAILAGSTLMPGAAQLCVGGALAGGASMIRLSTRGDEVPTSTPAEIVHAGDGVIDPRVQSVVAGPGLGADPTTWLAERLADYQGPLVLDADGLLAASLDLRPPASTWVLTPHEREFERLSGTDVPADHVAATRALAKKTDCVVLLKGPITVIANPAGDLRVVNVGTSALASAGTGDVLSGLIGATIARGHEPFEAAALAAHLHARAGSRLPRYATASDLGEAIKSLVTWLSRD